MNIGGGFMSNEEFWKDIGNYMNQILDTLSSMSKKMYISIMNLRTGYTWWSEKAAEYFGLPQQLLEFGKDTGNVVIHPEDKERYQKSMRDRMEGKYLTEPLEYRLKVGSGDYNTFSNKCQMIYDENKEPLLLIAIVDNYGISDDIDSITGLHTEDVFTRQINEIIDKCSHAALVKIGIDRFSNINVMYGAEYANRVLKQVAEKMLYLVKDAGQVYRLSGAKFAIYLQSADRDILQLFYNELSDIMAERIYIDGKKVPLKISCGAIILDYNIGDASSIKSRLTYAMNHSRHEHHGSLVLFNDEVCSSGGKDNLELITVIHECALQGCEGFYMCYQPIADTNTGKICGMEALLRWKKEPYGTIPPGVFIEWLEEDPCIYELGNWIIRQSLSDTARIIKERPDFFVNVNVSASQLERHEFRQAVLDMLRMSGVPASQFCIELTERCRELDIDFLREEVCFFKSHGIKVAMDDFGTGSASLSLALDLPIDELKIDMSFIRNIRQKPSNQAMVKSIVDYARNTSLETCIEGVEDEELLQYLKRYEATWHQGYYYSKPVPIEEFVKLL